ncbi:XRE family transcriptional regulator [Amycolatopsis balhimycina DSM 5908]|uniref:XRE family transcriptional regulator n=1 Tax=Amycolatopsis balhimycina DSM 5908 TaxID=1081091 RepID=A0A428VUL1_AMYBA|nr:helix-turn-helix transcriptional regulator [Amycolatopsis balhimycina]RSM34524.1 XRE family transcriptional regulator [Amycolatopsis balhimycina DSM 5908]
MLEPGRQDEQRATLAELLRELRQAAGLSGERLAARCAMSQAKISRIETGKILPSVIDVEQIVAALAVPGDAAEKLVALARVANVGYTSWRSLARTGLWRGQLEIKALHESSQVVRQFLPAIPSGLLQTPDYARQVLTSTVKGRPERDVDKMVEARLSWQRVLEEPGRRFEFVLTEQAIRWRRAPLAVMAGQSANLAALSERENVEISVVPQSSEIRASPLNLFVIYDERLVTVELFSGTVALRDPRDIGHHLELFGFFRSHALMGEESTGFLRSIAEEFRRESE